MENSLTKVCFHQLIRRETGVIEYCPVHIPNTAIRSQNDNGLRYCINHLLELSLRLLNLVECCLQRSLRTLALDGDSGDAARVVDQLNFTVTRAASFVKIHSKGAQHLPVVRRDWA